MIGQDLLGLEVDKSMTFHLTVNLRSAEDKKKCL